MANQAKTINQKGDLMSYRPDIKLLDATIRDGGLVNNFGFSDEFVKELYPAKERERYRHDKNRNIYSSDAWCAGDDKLLS